MRDEVKSRDLDMFLPIYIIYIYIYIYIYIHIYIYTFIYFYFFSEIWILLKTLSQKFCYIIKLVTFMYIPWIVMYLRLINTKISK